MVTGGIDAAFQIALINNLSVTSDLKVGSYLKMPLDFIDNEFLDFFKNIKPATSNTINQEELTQLPDGIDYMSIENDFIVK